MNNLQNDIKNCTICEAFLPHGVNPVLQWSKNSKIAIIGQAPGSVVHQTGIPWDDKSGDRLREWLGVTPEEFYNEDFLALIPMGFCYPGKGKSGDLPPRKECAPKWHSAIFQELDHLELILLVGTFAQNYYLKDRMEKTLTETVFNFENYGPLYLPLPHPSPRNNIWLKKNPWFTHQLLPFLKERIDLFRKG